MKVRKSFPGRIVKIKNTFPFQSVDFLACFSQTIKLCCFFITLLNTHFPSIVSSALSENLISRKFNPKVTVKAFLLPLDWRVRKSCGKYSLQTILEIFRRLNIYRWESFHRFVLLCLLKIFSLKRFFFHNYNSIAEIKIRIVKLREKLQLLFCLVLFLAKIEKFTSEGQMKVRIDTSRK